MPKCNVCHHPEYLAIEQALLSEDFTLAALSQKFGPSISALQRHKGHLRDKMRESRRRLQEIQEQGSLLLLNTFLDHVRKGVEAAEAEGNLTGVFRGSYIGSRIIYQLNRLKGSMSLDTLHRLLTSPAWVPQGSLLPTDSKLIADLHQALVDGAGLPCPEPPPEISGDDRDEDKDWDESEDDDEAADAADKPGGHVPADLLLDKSKFASAFSDTENGLLIRHLQELLPDLDLTLADLTPRIEKAAKNYRKISEKSTPKTPHNIHKSQQNHKDSQSEKKLPKNPSIGRDPKGGASQNGVPPAVLKSPAPPAVLENAAPPAVPDSAPPPEPCVEQDNEVHPAVPATDASSAFVAGDSSPTVPAMTNESEVPSPETQNDLLPNPCSLIPDSCLLNDLSPDPCLYLSAPETVSSPANALPTPPAAPAVTDESETPNLIPGNLRLESVFPRKNASPKRDLVSSCPFAVPASPDGEEPGLYNPSGNDLFLMTHGYPRDKPPKHIPNRRLDEDTRGFSLFREIKKFF